MHLVFWSGVVKVSVLKKLVGGGFETDDIFRECLAQSWEFADSPVISEALIQLSSWLRWLPNVDLSLPLSSLQKYRATHHSTIWMHHLLFPAHIFQASHLHWWALARQAHSWHLSSFSLLFSHTTIQRLSRLYKLLLSDSRIWSFLFMTAAPPSLVQASIGMACLALLH